MNTQHSPLPWEVVSAGVGFRRPHERHGDLALVAKDGICPGAVMALWSGGSFEPKLAETNAAFIVLACNAFPALVEALRAARRTIASMGGDLEVTAPESINANSYRDDLRRINDVLALAKPTPIRASGG